MHSVGMTLKGQGQGAGTRSHAADTHLFVHLDVQAIRHLIVLQRREGSISMGSPGGLTARNSSPVLVCGVTLLTNTHTAARPGGKIMVPSSLSGSRGVSGTRLQNGPSRRPCGRGSTMALPPRAGTARLARTPQLVPGENQAVTGTGTALRAQPHSQHAGKPKHPRGCASFDGSEETPPAALLLSGAAHSP